MKFFLDKFKDYFITIFLLLISLFILSKNESQTIKNVKIFIFNNFNSVSSLFSQGILFSDVRKENEELRKRNADLMIQVNKLREYALTNEQYLEMLALKDTTAYSLIASSVVAISYSINQHTITIDKGTDNGVTEGNPVINGYGLVGIVMEAGRDYSIIRTLINSQMKLIVKNERIGYEGILKWDGKNLLVTNIPKTAEIKKGDKIITSKLSSIITIPASIGTVQRVLNPELGYFNDIIIKPDVDFYNLKAVFVVKVSNANIPKSLEFRKSNYDN